MALCYCSKCHIDLNHALAHYGLARVAAAQGNREEALSFGEASLEAAGQRRYAKEVQRWLNMMRE